MPVALPVDLKVEATVETWPIAGTFTISRGAKREAAVVVARVGDGTTTGRGECVPYARYRETVEGVTAARAEARLNLTRSSFTSKTGSASTATAFGAGFRSASSSRNAERTEAEGRFTIS